MWNLFPEACLGGFAFYLAMHRPWEGRSQHGKVWKAELRGAHPPFPAGGRRVSPLPRGNSSWRQRIFPLGAPSALRLGGKRPSWRAGQWAGQGGLITSWESWPGWPRHRRCSYCGLGGRSPCCPIPRPSWKVKKQSLSLWKSPSHLQFPSHPNATVPVLDDPVLGAFLCPVAHGQHGVVDVLSVAALIIVHALGTQPVSPGVPQAPEQPHNPPPPPSSSPRL